MRPWNRTAAHSATAEAFAFGDKGRADDGSENPVTLRARQHPGGAGRPYAR
jgi:hypothetical protein